MIRNKTRQKVLCRKTETASSFWRKAVGLMFRKSAPDGLHQSDRAVNLKALGGDSGMLFVFSKPGRFRFWTPFMRFPIDIVFIDASGRVADIRENLRPWRMCRPNHPAKYVLELRAGRIRETETRKGDLLEFKL